MSLLQVKDLKVSYGGIKALKGISFDVEEGQIITLIGANGAGKSTILRSISGLVKPEAGGIFFDGKELTGMKPKEIVKSGVVLVPEGRRIFSNLSVRENLTLGAYLREDKDGINQDVERMYEIFPILKERAWQYAGTLSGGEQQMLAVARALMARPRLIMMDEPSLGLAPLVVKSIFEIIREINKEGTTILLIEQNANAALKLAHYGYVLETGNIRLSGSGADLLHDERVRTAYLGERKQEEK